MSFFHLRGMPAVVLGAALLLTVAATHAHAHALYAAHTWRDGVVLVQFAYSSGGQPTYAKVEVYSPADDKLEFQNGRTDALGRFAFMPDAPGLWRIIMADNMGHRVEHPVEVDAALHAPAAAPQTAVGPGGFSMPLRILLGLSLLGNAALGAAALRGKKKRAV